MLLRFPRCMSEKKGGKRLHLGCCANSLSKAKVYHISVPKKKKLQLDREAICIV